jgi:hypothetical protein
MLGLLKSWTPELPAELDAAGPKLLLTSGCNVMAKGYLDVNWLIIGKFSII